MIGPASRRHFTAALQLAGRAELEIFPGNLRDRADVALAKAQIELIRGVAFAFLEGEVTVKGSEDE